jgi:hypothetical protein
MKPLKSGFEELPQWYDDLKINNYAHTNEE